MKKVEKLRKKCLTNESVHGKILERSREKLSKGWTDWRSCLTANDRFEKNLKKVLDKLKRMW